MLPLVKRFSVLAALLLFLAMTATPQQNAEELVFSTSGSVMSLIGNSSGLTSTPFGFWIWCAFHASPSSTPVTYQGAQVCQGSMYFYALGEPEHVVSAFLTKEGPDGIYTLEVFGFKSPQQAAPDFECTLRNETLTSGPSNTVDVHCTFFTLGGGSGTAKVTNAVVNDTGAK